jgi:hypothetical protein
MAKKDAATLPGHCQRKPLISVILPIDNGQPYLADAVTSIQRQTVDDFELLAIDDQSTDGSTAYLNSVAQDDPRLRIISNPKKCLVGALNLGLRIAQGEFVARIDADDMSSPTRFERQLNFLNANPTIAVLGCSLTLIDGAGHQIGEVDYPTEPAQIHQALEHMDCAIAHSSVMARRSALSLVGGYREAFRYAEDYDLWLRVTESYKVANLGERLAFYRSHGKNVSSVYRYEQRLATHIALLCARERRLGHADPIGELEKLNLADLLRFDLDEGERAKIISSVLNAAPARARGDNSRLSTVFRKLVRHVILAAHRKTKRILSSPPL